MDDVVFRSHDPSDPDAPWRQLRRADDVPAAAPVDDRWVAPDYGTVARERTLAGAGPHRDWPGPPLVMPAGLLPDGTPLTSDDMHNAERIEGVRPRTAAEADACVTAYRVQQRLLRDEAGLPPARRQPPDYRLRDTPETLRAIARIHQAERARRAGRSA